MLYQAADTPLNSCVPTHWLQVVLAEYGLGAVALYYLAPFLLGGVFGSLRGYAGEVTAAQALDLVANDGSAVIIDIRTEVSLCTRAEPLCLSIDPHHHGRPRILAVTRSAELWHHEAAFMLRRGCLMP